VIEVSVSPKRFSPGFKETIRRLQDDVVAYFPDELAREYCELLRGMRLEMMLFEHTEPLDLPGADVPS
jgi:hypothetical protein